MTSTRHTPNGSCGSRRANTAVRATLVALTLLFAALSPVLAIVYVYNNTTSGAVPQVGAIATTVYTSTGANATITNDAYVGGGPPSGSPPSITGMACKTITVASESGWDTIVGPVTVTVPISHNRLGNLVIKLFTPTDDFTLMSRPGESEADDTGGDTGGGDTSNLVLTSPITFAMAATDDAEDMDAGNTLDGTEFACQDDGVCSYNPNVGATALSDDLTQLNGDSKVGDWTLCIGDAQSGTGGSSGGGENGTLGNWTLNLGVSPVDDSCRTNAANYVERTFSVTDNVTPTDVALGMEVSHLERGDIRAYLVHPNGTANQLVMAQNTADNNDHYSILITSNTDATGAPATRALNDNDTDPQTEPFYHRLVTLAEMGTTFDGLSATGTWRLRVCDRDSGNGVSGTLDRARLVLTDAVAAPQICTSTASYEFGDNGAGNPFTSATFNGITITQVSTNDLTGEGAADAFTTQTSTFGADPGHYLIRFDTTAANVETVDFDVEFSFSPPVRDAAITLLDVDTGAWEDYVRLTALDPGGSPVPYTMTNGPANQPAGDLSEADDGNIADTSPDGNVTYRFIGQVASVNLEYWQGDDNTNPNSQRIGIGNPVMCAYDFGDAPTGYGSAGHVLGARTVYLGAIPPDGEAATPGAPGTLANVDDNAAPGGAVPDDEDGVPSFPGAGLTPGATYTVPGIVVQNTTGGAVTLCGWIDFDINGQAGDGAFAADEGSCITVPASGSNSACTEGPVGTFTCSMSWTVPADFVINTSSDTYARFRVSTGALTTSSFNDPGTPNISPGEVEDYRIPAGTLPVTLAWVESSFEGDALAIRWATASESGNAGFRLWGGDGKGQRRLLASVRSQNSDSFVPLGYESVVDGRGIRSFEIEDLSVFGRNRLHGPFEAGEAYGVDPRGPEIDWASIRAESGVVTELDRMAAARGGVPQLGELAAPGRPGRPAGGALLYAREKGIHRATYEQLVAAGVNLLGVPVGRLALLDDGVAIPRYVHGPGATFGPGGYIEFFADPELTLASPVDAYVLRVDQRKTVTPQALAPAGGALGIAQTETTFENEVGYSYSSPNGDPWYDAAVLAWGGPGSVTRNFDLPDLAAGTVELDFRGWGWGAWPGTNPPDHHVVVKLNGSQIADELFDGPVALDLTLDVTSQAQAAGNQLEVELPGDTGYQFDYFAYDGFTVRYPRATLAVGGRFAGRVATPGGVAIGGFAEGEAVAIWRRAGAKVWRGEQVAVGGEVSALGGAELYAASSGAVHTPGIERNVPGTQVSSSAEYVIVTHPAFAGSLSALVALQEAKGLSTEVVTVDRIYAAYSDHAPSAQAVKQFFAASLAEHLRYALIVGADSSDPYDHLGLGSVSFVPTDYLPLSEYVHYSPTDESLVDADGDGLGDAPIGRLPARTPTELDAMVAKLVAWEAAVGSGRTALLSAGISDTEAATLALLNAAYAASLPAWSVGLAAVDEIGTDAARTAVLDALNGGVKLVSYVGHSSMGQWDWTPLLRWNDAATLVNNGAPNLVTAWGCWNSYYVEPTIESLAARLLRQPDAGAAGAIGATTLTSEASHQALGSLFFAQVNAGAATVGDAFHAAKQALAAQGGAADAILGMTLLGDPAMSLPPVE